MKSIQNLRQLDELMQSLLEASRIPGIGLAVVANTEIVMAKGFGWCSLDKDQELTAQTWYPIASTTKAFNAALLGILVDEGRLAWDMPVQRYIPRFGLHDSSLSARVTVRDLVAMRTGLPRHDYAWIENRVSRADVVERLAHLPLSADLRERYQYNNLTTTVAGHVAEVITGQTWEELIKERLLGPLRMNDTVFAVPARLATHAYHENHERRLLPTPRKVEQAMAPAGGSIHSTVRDMARWIAFNLNGGRLDERQWIQQETLRGVHSPCIFAGSDPAAPSPAAAYGLGWFIDRYNGHRRLSHTGLLYDINSCVTLFPEDGLGMVSFSNFASARLAAIVNQHAFDLIMGLTPVQTFPRALEQYETRIEETCRHNASARRVSNTVPSHPTADYAGKFEHAGYGEIEVCNDGGSLTLLLNELALPLEHWHYDAWVVAANDLFEIHSPHAFDQTNRLLFDTDADGEIAGVSLHLEPSVAPIRFQRK